jgi:hypothetical protein
VPLGELGGALFTAERAAERADGLLTRVDRDRLAARLNQQREMAVFSKRAEQEAESLAAQIATVERATDHRRRLTGMAREATGLLDDPGGVTTSQITATRDGVAEATEALDAAVTRAAAALDPLSFKLTRTRHRGIYRSGERYLVPFVDDLGADRSRDFDSLSDARAFRATVRIAEDAKPGYEPRWHGDASG